MASPLIRNFKIFKTPSEHLSKICQPVTFPLTEQTKDNIVYLKTCFRKNIGQQVALALSAPQVGINQKFFILPKSYNYLNHVSSPATMRSMLRGFIVVINPAVHVIEKNTLNQEQSCLSSQYSYMVDRYTKIQAQFQDEDGTSQKIPLQGFHARVFQHETDHLNGVTIQDIGKIVINDDNEKIPQPQRINKQK